MNNIFIEKIQNNYCDQVQKYKLDIKGYSKWNLYRNVMTLIEGDLEGVLFKDLDEQGLLEKFLPDIEGLKVVGKCYYHAEPAFIHMNRVYMLFQQLLKGNMNVENLDVEIFKQPLYQYINKFRTNDINLKSRIESCRKEELYYKCGTYVALAAFCHDIGKYRSYKQQGEKVSFHGHDREGAKLMGEFCKRYEFPKGAEETIVKIVEGHMYPLSLFNSNLKDARKSFIKFFDKYTIYVPFILAVSICDMYGKSLSPTKENEKEDFKKFIEGLLCSFKEYAKI